MTSCSDQVEERARRGERKGEERWRGAWVRAKEAGRVLSVPNELHGCAECGVVGQRGAAAESRSSLVFYSSLAQSKALAETTDTTVGDRPPQPCWTGSDPPFTPLAPPSCTSKSPFCLCNGTGESEGPRDRTNESPMTCQRLCVMAEGYQDWLRESVRPLFLLSQPLHSGLSAQTARTGYEDATNAPSSGLDAFPTTIACSNIAFSPRPAVLAFSSPATTHGRRCRSLPQTLASVDTCGKTKESLTVL